MIFWLKHQFFDFSRLLGLRDRLRCPICRAVGTWKPHGGWLDFEDERPVRRWLCKWCGYYEDKQDWGQARIGKTSWVCCPKEWRNTTPTPRNKCKPWDPWKG